MPTAYKVEVSPNRRAGCVDTKCKKEGRKIDKDEVRFGTWVEVQGASFQSQSWKYKHW
jgi:hypothetical protein